MVRCLVKHRIRFMEWYLAKQRDNFSFISFCVCVCVRESERGEGRCKGKLSL